MQRDPIGYPDGMNGYEYSGSRPIAVVDSAGLTIEPKTGITGSYEAFIKGKKDKDRFIYTCKCGWLDRSHFNWDKDYKEVYDAVVSASNMAAGKSNEVSPTYRGALGGVKVTYTIRNRGRLAGVGRQVLSLEGEAIQYTSIGIFMSLFKTGEAQQMLNIEPMAMIFSDRAATVYSLEDLPTNFVGLFISSEIHKAKVNAANAKKKQKAVKVADLTKQLLSEHCGTVLSKKNARCLYDQMTDAEKTKKNYSHHPVLFSNKAACKACNNAEASEIFTVEAMKAAIYYRTFVNIKAAVFESKVGFIQAVKGGKPVRAFAP